MKNILRSDPWNSEPLSHCSIKHLNDEKSGNVKGISSHLFLKISPKQGNKKQIQKYIHYVCVLKSYKRLKGPETAPLTQGSFLGKYLSGRGPGRSRCGPLGVRRGGAARTRAWLRGSCKGSPVTEQIFTSRHHAPCRSLGKGDIEPGRQDPLFVNLQIRAKLLWWHVSPELIRILLSLLI